MKNGVNRYLNWTKQKVDEHTFHAKTIEKENQRAKENQELLTHWEMTRSVVTQLAEEVQQTVHTRLAQVVSHALSSVFDEPYQFDITFERKRNRTEAVLSFVRDGETVDPMTASGGGVVDVASFALRLACLVLSQRRHLLFMDEPMKFVSADLRPRVATMIQEMSEKLGVQFVIVTHDPEFQLGKVVQL